jgi:hypothetical protein
VIDPPSSRHREESADVAQRQRFSAVSALVVLPLLLGGVAWLGAATHLRFLLYPPLAAIGYALFLDPYGRRASLRDGVLGPVVGAVVGVAAAIGIPAVALRVMLVTAVGILALRLLRIGLTQALAVALLTLLVGAEGITYIISIFASSLALALVFRLWRGFLYARAFPEAESGSPSAPA